MLAAASVKWARSGHSPLCGIFADRSCLGRLLTAQGCRSPKMIVAAAWLARNWTQRAARRNHL